MFGEKSEATNNSRSSDPYSVSISFRVDPRFKKVTWDRDQVAAAAMESIRQYWGDNLVGEPRLMFRPFTVRLDG